MDLTQLFQRVDTFGTNFVQQTFQALSNALTAGSFNVAALMLTLYVIFWGVGIWQGTAKGGPSDHAFRLFRAFAIYAMATGWADFQVLVYRFMNEGPSAIGNAMLTTVSANATGNMANLNSVNGVQTALQNLYLTAGNTASAYLQNAGVLNFGAYIFAGILMVTMVVLVAFAAFLIILSKLFMWLLLALAPLFIILLLFGFTSRYFSGWANTLVTYFVVQVLVYGTIAFIISIAQTYIDAVNAANANASTNLGQILPVILIAVVGTLLLTQVQTAAMGITGTMGFRSPTPGAMMRPMAFAAGAAGGRLWQRMGGTLPSERREGRQHARSRLLADKFKQSGEYKALADKLQIRD
jgi:type IV secretion system protein VirB6